MSRTNSDVISAARFVGLSSISHMRIIPNFVCFLLCRLCPRSRLEEVVSILVNKGSMVTLNLGMVNGGGPHLIEKIEPYDWLPKNPLLQSHFVKNLDTRGT